jgi:hypothetical protein
VIRIALYSTIILWLLKSHFVVGQFENPFQAFKEKRQFIYGIDNRRTHVLGQSTTIYGAYLGVGFGKKLRFKVSLSGTPFEVGLSENELGLIRRNRFYFFSIGEEFDIYTYKRFALTTYLQAGIGENQFRKTTTEGVFVSNGKHLIIPIEVGMHGNYYFYPWLALKLGGGWRFVPPSDASYLSGYYLKIALGFSTSEFLNWNRERKAQKLVN